MKWELLSIFFLTSITLSGTNNLSYYDGLLKIVDADGTTVAGNTGSVAAITSANVLDVLDVQNS